MDRLSLQTRRFLTGITLVSLLLVVIPYSPVLKDLAKPVQATHLTALGIWSQTYSSSAVVDPTVITGGFLRLKVNVTGGTNINGFDITVRWDATLLNATAGPSISGGIFAQKNLLLLRNETKTDHVRLSEVALSSNVPANGTIFTFGVKVLGIGSTTIGVDKSVSSLTSPSVVPYVALNGFFSNSPGVADLALSSVSISQESIPLTETAQITVGVRNIGSSIMDAVTVTVYLNSTLLGTKIIGIMPANTAQSTLMAWDTTGFSLGVYNITATVTTSSVDSFPDDNRLSILQATVVIHDLAIVSLTTPSTSVIRNSTVNVKAVVENLGTVSDQANVTVYANNVVIKLACPHFPCPSSLQFNLDPGLSHTFTFAWNTTGLTLGAYSLRATMQPVPGEHNTANNQITGPTVTVKISFEHDLGIAWYGASQNIVIGSNVTLTLDVKNYGVSTDYYKLRVFLGANVIFTHDDSAVPLETKTTTFVWNTASSQSGFYALRANVTDTSGIDENPLNDQVAIQVSLEATQAPTASFTFTPQTPNPGVSIFFNASKSLSHNRDGMIKSYLWDFGDGTTGSGKTINHTYTSAGTYAVKLTVLDNYGARQSTSGNVDVKVVPLKTPPQEFPIYLVGGIGAAVAIGLIATGLFLRSRRARLR